MVELFIYSTNDYWVLTTLLCAGLDVYLRGPKEFQKEQP